MEPHGQNPGFFFGFPALKTSLPTLRHRSPSAKRPYGPQGACPIGSEQFQQELLNQMVLLPESRYGGPEWRERAEDKARRILAEEMRQRSWDPSQLELRRKGDPEKVQIARRLRAETTMTLAWIAQSLNMGAPGALANLLRQHRQ